MDMGEPTRWTDNDKSVLNSLLREFRTGELDAEFPNGTFADDGTVNYWKEGFWRALCRLFNNRAHAANASQREPYEMILRGEQLRGEFCIQGSSMTLGEIFSPCAACQQIPVFPTSLLQKLGYDRTGRSSGGGNSITGGVVDTGADQVIDVVCSMRERRLITADSVSKILDVAGELFKEGGCLAEFYAQFHTFS